MKKINFLMVFLIITYLFLYLRTSLLNHWGLGSYYFDLGIIHQTVYNTSRGRFFELTNPYGKEQISRFSIHFDPILIIFAPFYLLFPQAEVLIIGEIILVISAVIPLYLLIKLQFKKERFFSWLALVIIFSFLNYYPLSSILTKNFHAVSLTIPLFFWAIYFFEKNNYSLGAFFLFLSAFCKESLFLTMVSFLFYYLLAKKKLPKKVLLPLIFSLIILLFYLRPQKENRFFKSYYDKDPGVILKIIFSKKAFTYLKTVNQPLGFLPLFHPSFFIALPEISLNILAKNTNLTSVDYHYEAVIIPFLFLSLILTLKKLRQIDERLMWAAILFLFLNNFFFFPKNRIYFFKSFVNEKKLAVVKEWQKKLKNDQIKVSASGHLAPYFSGRRYFYNFLFDFAYENFQLTAEDIKKQANFYQQAEFYQDHLFQNKNFQLIFSKEGVWVFKKVSY